MAEQMSSKCKNYLPNESVDAVYQTWARGGWGMVLTGTHHLPAIILLTTTTTTR